MKDKVVRIIMNIVVAALIICFALGVALYLSYHDDVDGINNEIVDRALWELEKKHPDFTREEICNIVLQKLQNYERDGLQNYGRYKLN